MQEYRADLHIHSCLSPCASLHLSPRNIVNRARQAGLDIIAITDHNSAQNVYPIMRLGEQFGLRVIPGIEVQSREEIHLLTLFPDWATIVPWEEEVRRNLPEMPNDPEVFGEQPIVDEEGNILRFEDRLLLNSIRLSMNEVQRKVSGRGGLTIPAHFDKASFSLISQLGFIPPDGKWEALEISRAFPSTIGRDGSNIPSSIPLIASSDAHELEDIGRGQTVFLLAAPSLLEIRLAFQGQEGRKVIGRLVDGRPVLG